MRREPQQAPPQAAHRAQHRMCSDKTRFASEIAAMRSGAKFDMDWYRCPYCGGYHLTSKNRMKGTES